jgi:hypothetical protein
MPIRLSIEAETVEEFDTLLARFARSGEVSPIMPEIAHTAAAAEVPKTTGRKPKAAAPTQNPDGSPISPTHTPEPQPTPGGTDAPPAESIPPNQGNGQNGAAATATDGGSASRTSAADPFAQPAADTASVAAGATTAVETTSATPAATSGEAVTGDVTIQHLKDAMSELLKAKSASVAMQVLADATGCKSLTSGSPNVAEKAKDDPTILKRTLDALVAAKTAA